MAQNTENKKEVNTTTKIESKIESAAESFSKGFDKFAGSLDKGMDKFSNTLDEKITNFDEEKFEENLQKFFVKVGKGIATFFTATLPKVVKKVFAFFNISMPKIFESDTWGFIAPLLFIIIALVIIVAIASGLRNWLFS